MGSNIRYSTQALHDLDDIWEHIAHELQNPSAAKRVVDKIMDAVDQLKMFPEMGSPLSAIAGENAGYRFLVSGSYMVFYRPHGCQRRYEIVRKRRRNFVVFRRGG